MHSTNIQHVFEVRGSLPLIRPKPKGKRFISSKLPMTEGKGNIIVEYTIIAMVYMIYIMGMSY